MGSDDPYLELRGQGRPGQPGQDHQHHGEHGVGGPGAVLDQHEDLDGDRFDGGSRRFCLHITKPHRED